MTIETSAQKDNFDKQFDEPTIVSLGDVDVPVRILTNEKAEDKKFVFFAPGYAMEVEEMYKDHALRAMHEMKRNIFTFDPPAEGAEFELTDAERKALEGNEIPNEEIRMAKTMIRVVENLRANKKIEDDVIDVAAHSRGLGYATAAALLRPDLFRTLGAYGGAGLRGEDNVPSLLWRTMVGQQHFRWWNPIDWGAEATDMKQLAKEIVTEQKKEGKNWFTSLFVKVSDEEIADKQKSLEAKKEAAAKKGIEEYAAPTPEQKKIIGEVASKAGGVTVKYLLGAPGRRLRELGGMANIKINNALVKLAKEHGINVVLAYGDSDPVFEKDRQNEYTMSEEFKDAGILLVSAAGTHGTIGERPVIARVLMGAINVMNEERKRPKAGTEA